MEVKGAAAGGGEVTCVSCATQGVVGGFGEGREGEEGFSVEHFLGNFPGEFLDGPADI